MSLVMSGAIQAHALRIGAGEDLLPNLLKAAKDAMETSSSQSAFMMTVVGSLELVELRMANAAKGGDIAACPTNEIKEWNQRMEVVSLVGTFSFDGSKHLHMSVSDKDGNVFGGHLISGKTFTTMEVVIGTIGGVTFSREIDQKTGFDELVVRSS